MAYFSLETNIGIAAGDYVDKFVKCGLLISLIIKKTKVGAGMTV